MLAIHYYYFTKIINFILNFLFQGLENQYFWTSGNDLADEGNFMWMPNGQPFDYTNWGTDEPSKRKESYDCVELFRRKNGLTWKTCECTENHFFICESPITEVSILNQ